MSQNHVTTLEALHVAIDLEAIAAEFGSENSGDLEVRERILQLKEDGFTDKEVAKEIMHGDYAWVKGELEADFQALKALPVVGKVLQAMYDKDGGTAGPAVNAACATLRRKVEAEWLKAHPEIEIKYARRLGTTILERIIDEANFYGARGSKALDDAAKLCEEHGFESLKPNRSK